MLKKPIYGGRTDPITGTADITLMGSSIGIQQLQSTLRSRTGYGSFSARRPSFMRLKENYNPVSLFLYRGRMLYFQL